MHMVTRGEAQKSVLAALEELQKSVVTAGDSVSYLSAEVALLQGKMCTLEKSTHLIYNPFRESLLDYATEGQTQQIKGKK
mmetsp:Transcript_69557/g.101971  ORF Transcript_69557/g.101971 Transcript_69557/m.101971 type:complete len:80 (+) Transcript_69557:14-253(+)